MFEVTTPEESKARVEAFKALHAKFRAGARWLGEKMAAWTGGREWMPRIDGDIKDFREKVEGPMDEFWNTMSNEEREAVGDVFNHGN